MDKRVWLGLHVFGLCTVLSCTVTLIVIFVFSGFNGYSQLVTTNDFSEHWFELFVFVLGLLCFLGTYNKIRIYRKRSVRL